MTDRPSVIDVRAAAEADHAWIRTAAQDVLGGDYQVHTHRQFGVLDVDVLIAESGGERIGFLSWEIEGSTCETLAIACTTRRIGAGTALMQAVHHLACRRGCERLRVVTTDANAGAQRFYQRLGYRLRERRVGAVDECRRLYKPSIPADTHDELEYDRGVDVSG